MIKDRVNHRHLQPVADQHDQVKAILKVPQAASGYELITA